MMILFLIILTIGIVGAAWGMIELSKYSDLGFFLAVPFAVMEIIFIGTWLHTLAVLLGM